MVNHERFAVEDVRYWRLRPVAVDAQREKQYPNESARLPTPNRYAVITNNLPYVKRRVYFFW